MSGAAMRTGDKPISSFSVFEFVDEAEAAATAAVAAATAGRRARDVTINASGSRGAGAPPLTQGDILDFQRGVEGEEEEEWEQDGDDDAPLPGFFRRKKETKKSEKEEEVEENENKNNKKKNALQKPAYPFQLPETPATEMGKRKLRGDGPSVVPAFKSSNFLNTQFVRSFPEKEDQKLLSDAVIALDDAEAARAAASGAAAGEEGVGDGKKESRSAESLDGADRFLIEGKSTIFSLTEAGSEVKAPEGPAHPDMQKRLVWGFSMDREGGGGGSSQQINGEREREREIAAEREQMGVHRVASQGNGARMLRPARAHEITSSYPQTEPFSASMPPDRAAEA